MTKESKRAGWERHARPIQCFVPLQVLSHGFFDTTRNSTQSRKNTFKLPTSNSNSVASPALGECTWFCQFVPSVRLVELIQAVGSAARLCKDHSRHLFTLDCSLPLCHPSSKRGCGGERRRDLVCMCVQGNTSQGKFGSYWEQEATGQ